MKLAVRLLLTVGVFIGIIWFGVRVLTEIFEADNATVVAEKSGLSDSEVSDILSELFKKMAIPWTGSNDAPSLDLSTAEDLRDRCAELDVESYLIKVDTQWRWRIYERHGLLYDWTIGDVNIVLSEEIPAITTTESFTVALLIEGLDNHLIHKLLQHSAILNFSLRPTSPFTLRNAIQAAAHWREVALDIRTMSEFSIESIPYASAVRSTEPLPLPYGITSIESNQVQPVNLSDPMPFSTDFRIYSIDMTKYNDAQVITWLDTLPSNIHLVRLSHWDIHAL